MTTMQQLAAAQESPEVIINENFESLSAAAIFSKKHSTTTGLTLGIYGGLYNGNVKDDTTVSLTDASDNYVVVLRSTGVVSTSTSSTNSTDPLYAKLYKATCAGGAITVLLDQRKDTNGLDFTGSTGSIGDMTLASVQTVTGAKTFGSAGAVGKLKIAGTTSGAATLDAAAVAGTAVITLPTATGTLMTSAEIAAAYQPLDADVTTFAGLTATTDNFLQAKASAWASRTPAQVATDLRTPINALNNVVSALSTSGAVNIDCSLGDYFTLAATGNVTSITFSNLPGAGKGASKWIQFTQDSTPRTVAWPGSFKWAGGVAGAVSTGSGVVDELAITTVDNGTTWKATLAKAFA